MLLQLCDYFVCVISPQETGELHCESNFDNLKGVSCSYEFAEVSMSLGFTGFERNTAAGHDF